jgi:hypothetical protein
MLFSIACVEVRHPRYAVPLTDHCDIEGAVPATAAGPCTSTSDWAMDFLGLIRFAPTDTHKLLPSLCDVVRAGVSGD